MAEADLLLKGVPLSHHYLLALHLLALYRQGLHPLFLCHPIVPLKRYVSIHRLHLLY